MAITVGTASFPNLTAQPFGYEESDTRNGLTARKWSLVGLLKPSEWLALLGVYDAWRNTRINDPDTLESEAVGTTIAFSGKGAGGVTWTSIACWFISAPVGEQVGNRIRASVELVDANQALAVLLKQQEEEAAAEDRPDLGTVVVGGVTLTLLKPMETYAQGPSLELTATGKHYVTGPLVVQKIRDIEGTTNVSGWNSIRSWYESQIVARPASGVWWPISAPTATAENVIISGVKSVQYTVSLQLGYTI